MLHLEQGHCGGEGSGLPRQEHRALRLARQQPQAHDEAGIQLASLGQLGGEPELAVTLEEGDGLLIGVEEVCEDEGGLFDASLALQALEGASIGPSQQLLDASQRHGRRGCRPLG